MVGFDDDEIVRDGMNDELARRVPKLVDALVEHLVELVECENSRDPINIGVSQHSRVLEKG